MTKKKKHTRVQKKKNCCCAESYTQITTGTQTRHGPGARRLQPSAPVLSDKKGKRLQATAVTTKQVVPLCNTTHGVKLPLLLRTKKNDIFVIFLGAVQMLPRRGPLIKNNISIWLVAAGEEP